MRFFQYLDLPGGPAVGGRRGGGVGDFICFLIYLAVISVPGFAGQSGGRRYFVRHGGGGAEDLVLREPMYLY